MNEKYKSDNNLPSVKHKPAQNSPVKPFIFVDNNYIETVHQINSAKNFKTLLGILPSLYLIGSFPSIQTENPFIFSDKVFHPVSFLNNQLHTGFSKGNNTLESPSPTFVEYNLICLKPDLSKHGILRGMTIDDKLGLILVDPHLSNRFKGVVGDMMSSMFSKIFTRKPVSLPVKIFEPKSTLQRITEYWSFAPMFLPLASKEADSIEKLKYVICFAIAGLYPSSKQLKPFNPLLGETFEGYFDDNSSVYCEHISHYPSVTRFLIQDVNKKYSVSGYYEYNSKAKSMGGKLSFSQKGPNRVDFNGNNLILYNMPKLKLLNCRSDTNRSNIWKGIMVFVDVKNNTKAIIRFGNNQERINNLEGYIITHTFPKNYKYNIDEEIIIAKKLFKDSKSLQKLCRIHGNWLDNISFDNKIYWNINTYSPSWVCPSQNILPSDGRFREDIIWLFRSLSATEEVERKKYEEFSQNWKHLIETIQRKDRELRKKK